MTRPLLNRGIDELERLVEEVGLNPGELETVLSELNHRSSRRSERLKRRVLALLSTPSAESADDAGNMFATTAENGRGDAGIAEKRNIEQEFYCTCGTRIVIAHSSRPIVPQCFRCDRKYGVYVDEDGELVVEPVVVQGRKYEPDWDRSFPPHFWCMCGKVVKFVDNGRENFIGCRSCNRTYSAFVDEDGDVYVYYVMSKRENL